MSAARRELTGGDGALVPHGLNRRRHKEYLQQRDELAETLRQLHKEKQHLEEKHDELDRAYAKKTRRLAREAAQQQHRLKMTQLEARHILQDKMWEIQFNEHLRGAAREKKMQELYAQFEKMLYPEDKLSEIQHKQARSQFNRISRMFGFRLGPASTAQTSLALLR